MPSMRAMTMIRRFRLGLDDDAQEAACRCRAAPLMIRDWRDGDAGDFIGRLAYRRAAMAVPLVYWLRRAAECQVMARLMRLAAARCLIA